LFGPVWARKGAFIVFAIAAISDLIDGPIARHFSGVTKIGRRLDPIADRALIIAAIIGLYIHGSIPTWAMFAVIGRDVVMGTGILVATALKKPVIPVTLYGKATNFFLMGAIVLMLFDVAFLAIPIYVWLFNLGVVLYLTSGLLYIIQEVSFAYGPAREGLSNES
jgi:CDP-diacylglycerol--glycerol-3-phosphate 3-phosphatidyltransferase